MMSGDEIGSTLVCQHSGGQEVEKNEIAEDYLVFRERRNNLRTRGREAEFQRLLDAYRRACDLSHSELVLIHGDAGAGKNTLVEELVQNVNTPYFCEAKFDQILTNNPYSSIMEACNQLCQIIQHSGDLEEIRNNLLQKPETQLLSQLMAGFVDLYGVPLHRQKSARRMSSGLSRIKVVLRSFFNCICSAGKPVILFLNDLQWADENSLQIIRALITDPNAKHLLVVCTYSEERLDQEIIEKYLLNMAEDTSKASFSGISSFGFNIGVVDIYLSNLNIHTVNDIVSELCEKDKAETLELASNIHRATNGNPYYVLQHMDLLFREGLLKINEETLELEYELCKVLERINPNGDVTNVLIGKIDYLPTRALDVLYLASYLGNPFSAKVLEHIVKHEIPDLAGNSALSRDRVASALATGIQENLLEKVEDTVYRFPNDSVQELFYSNCSTSTNKSLQHLRIGRLILDYNEHSMPVDETVLFLALDQLNKGTEDITDAKEKDKLSRLNFLAAKLSSKKSALHSATKYLRLGFSLFDADAWEVKYDLCLEMYSMAAEVEFNTGNVVRGTIMANEVHRHAKTIEERIPVFLTEVVLRATQGEIRCAMELGISILKKLGVAFPSKPNAFHIRLEMIRTQRVIRGRGSAELLNLPLMVDTCKLAVMKLLSTISLHSFMWGDKGRAFFFLSLLQMVRFSCEYGLCTHSPQAFVGYGIGLAMLGNFNEGVYFGTLGSEMIRSLGAKEISCRSTVLGIQYLMGWKVPVKDCAQLYLDQYRDGIAYGDTEFAYMATYGYLSASYYSGVHLDEILEKCRQYTAEMQEVHLPVCLSLVLPFLQMIEKLRGNDKDPQILIGSAFNYDTVVAELESDQLFAALAGLRVCELRLAYFFGNYEALYSLVKEIDKYWKWVGGNIIGLVIYTHFSFACSALYRKTGRRAYRRKCRNSHRVLQRWVGQGRTTAETFAALAHAFLVSSSKSCSRATAEKALNTAIELCCRDKLTNLEGQAHERLAEFMLDDGDPDEAEKCIRFAITKYENQGLTAKVIGLKRGKYKCLFQKIKGIKG